LPTKKKIFLKKGEEESNLRLCEESILAILGVVCGKIDSYKKNGGHLTETTRGHVAEGNPTEEERVRGNFHLI